jgi:hypothetical protein
VAQLQDELDAAQAFGAKATSELKTAREQLARVDPNILNALADRDAMDSMQKQIPELQVCFSFA